MFAPICQWELFRILRRGWFSNVRLLYALTMAGLFLWSVNDLQNLPYFGRLYDVLDRFHFRASGSRHLLMMVHVLTVVLLTPILAVGAMAQEKTQRTLELLLTTNLTALDIVLGHWLATVAKMVLLTLPGVPLLLFMHALLDAPWWTMTLWIACTWLAACPLAALALFAAIRLRWMISALLAGYVASGVLVMVLFAMSTDAQLSLWDHAVYDVAFWLTFSQWVIAPIVLALIVAILQLRSAHALQQERTAPRRDVNRPPVDDLPIFWKQYHLSARHLPAWTAFIPRWGWLALIVVVSSGVALLPEPADVWGVVLMLNLVPVATLTWTGTAVTAEREAQTWDSLRLTTHTAN
jgi:hypothetical protein